MNWRPVAFQRERRWSGCERLLSAAPPPPRQAPRKAFAEPAAGAALRSWIALWREKVGAKSARTYARKKSSPPPNCPAPGWEGYFSLLSNEGRGGFVQPSSKSARSRLERIPARLRADLLDLKLGGV